MAAPAQVLRPGQQAPQPVRRWPGRLRTGIIVLLAMCVLLAGGSYVYLRHQIGRIDRLVIPGLVDGNNTSVMNVLMVGSDSRENVEGDLANATGKGEVGTSGQRSDTIMILHIDPRQTKATILSIPRDLYIPIAGTGGRDKINSAFSLGGPQRLIETIQQGLGIDINHYAEVDFSGFERIVKTIGGIKVYVDAPARDAKTGLDIPVAGCSELDGYQALAFVRSRYYETYERGRWVSGTNSDLDRITRQQEFIRRIMKKAVSSGLTNPLTLNRLISIGVDNIKVDQAMSTRDITSLAKKFRSLDADTIEMLTLPTNDAYLGGAAVQLLDKEKASAYIDRLNGKVAPPSGAANPAGVSIRVLNGNGIEGAAAKAAASLEQFGFKVTGTATADNYGYAETVVRYSTAGQAQAELLRSHLAGGARLERDTNLAAGEVTLVLGADYTGARTPTTGAPATGSTAASGLAQPTTTTVFRPPC